MPPKNRDKGKGKKKEEKEEDGEESGDASREEEESVDASEEEEDDRSGSAEDHDDDEEEAATEEDDEEDPGLRQAQAIRAATGGATRSGASTDKAGNNLNAVCAVTYVHAVCAVTYVFACSGAGKSPEQGQGEGEGLDYRRESDEGTHGTQEAVQHSRVKASSAGAADCCA
jgi:hypothetical protein